MTLKLPMETESITALLAATCITNRSFRNISIIFLSPTNKKFLTHVIFFFNMQECRPCTEKQDAGQYREDVQMCGTKYIVLCFSKKCRCKCILFWDVFFFLKTLPFCERIYVVPKSICLGLNCLFLVNAKKQTLISILAKKEIEWLHFYQKKEKAVR